MKAAAKKIKTILTYLSYKNQMVCSCLYKICDKSKVNVSRNVGRNLSHSLISLICYCIFPAPPPDDIEGFLAASKDRVDDDPDGLPIDDVRNYAYEGDGNSVGSLSSLASGTDDEDLNFDYLPTFGPRFKKLADMYGGQSSDDESYIGGSTSGGEPSAWC